MIQVKISRSSPDYINALESLQSDFNDRLDDIRYKYFNSSSAIELMVKDGSICFIVDVGELKKEEEV